MLEFEWDSEKAAQNFLKHGVLFETAVGVFDDEDRIEIYDREHSTRQEDRYITIGMAGKMMFVVYTERGQRIRLISARLATKEEQKLYYDSL